MPIAQNLRRDKEGKFNATINKHLACCDDEKFIAARTSHSRSANILNVTNQYNDKIEKHLTNLSLEQYKENQQINPQKGHLKTVYPVCARLTTVAG